MWKLSKRLNLVAILANGGRHGQLFLWANRFEGFHKHRRDRFEVVGELLAVEHR
jgi:hypothetical protein